MGCGSSSSQNKSRRAHRSDGKVAGRLGIDEGGGEKTGTRDPSTYQNVALIVGGHHERSSPVQGDRADGVCVSSQVLAGLPVAIYPNESLLSANGEVAILVCHQRLTDRDDCGRQIRIRNAG